MVIDDIPQRGFCASSFISFSTLVFFLFFVFSSILYAHLSEQYILHTHKLSHSHAHTHSRMHPYTRIIAPSFLDIYFADISLPCISCVLLLASCTARFTHCNCTCIYTVHHTSWAHPHIHAPSPLRYTFSRRLASTKTRVKSSQAES